MTTRNLTFPGLTRLRREWSQTCDINYDIWEDPYTLEVGLRNGMFIEIVHTGYSFKMRVYRLYGGQTFEETEVPDALEMLDTLSGWCFLYTREVAEHEALSFDEIMLLETKETF